MKVRNKRLPKTDFGIEVRIFAAQKGMTLKELAEASGVKYTTQVYAELPEGGIVMTAVKTARDMYYFVDDVMQLLGFSRSKSYRIIQNLNKELDEQGKIVFEGRVPQRYFRERLGLETELYPDQRGAKGRR